MSIDKKAVVHIQKGPMNDYGLDDTDQTPNIERDHMYFGREYGEQEFPYGGGGEADYRQQKIKLELRDDQDNAKHSRPSNCTHDVRMSPDGTITIKVHKPSKESNMFDYKAGIAYILTRLANSSLGSYVEQLKAALGRGVGVTPKAIAMLKQLSTDVEKFFTGDTITALEETSVALKQIQTKAAMGSAVVKEFNVGLENMDKVYGGLTSIADQIGHAPLNSLVDRMRGTIVDLNLLAFMAGGLVKSTDIKDPITGKVVKIISRMEVSGPKEYSEKDVIALKAGILSLLKNTEAFKHNESKIAAVIKTLDNVATGIIEEGGTAKKKVSVLMAQLNKLSQPLQDMKDKLISAYRLFIDKLEKEHMSNDTVKRVVTVAKNNLVRVESLADAAELDPSTAPQALGSFMQSFVAQSSILQDLVKDLSQPDVSDKGPVASDNSFMTVTAADDFSDVLGLIESANNPKSWNELITSLQPIMDELTVLSEDVKALKLEYDDAMTELNKYLGGIIETPTHSIVNEMSALMEKEPVAASLVGQIDVQAAEFELSPKLVRDRMEQLVAPGSSKTYQEELGTWTKALNDYLPKTIVFHFMAIAFKNVQKLIHELKIGPAKTGESSLAALSDAIRNDLVNRQTEIKETTDYSGKIKFVEKTISEGGSDLTSDLFQVFFSRLKEGEDEGSDFLREALKDPAELYRIKLLLATAIKGSHVDFQVTMNKPNVKQIGVSGDIDLDELISVLDKQQEIVPYLDSLLAESSNDVETAQASGNETALEKAKQKQAGYKSLSMFIKDIGIHSAAIRRATDPATQELKAKELLDVVNQYKTVMDQAGIKDFKLDEFADRLWSLLEKNAAKPEPVAPVEKRKSSYSLLGLFASMENPDQIEDPPAEASSTEVITEIVDIIWPQIMEAYDEYESVFVNALDELEAELGGVSMAPERELAGVGAGADDNDFDRTASIDIVTPLSPNTMYSHYDMSENKLEMCDDNGQAKIRIHKNLRNLVTKRINEFFKGAYQEGAVVNVDFGSHIAVGTVQAYLGNGNYRIASESGTVEVSENKLFKI